MFKYIHDVNAKVEQSPRYLTDVVKLEMKPVDDKFVVTVHPAVATGVENTMSIPVHPKTESLEIQVPTYSVPEKLTALVRKDVSEIKQDTSNGNHSNWEEVEIEVSPIIHEEFEDEADSIKFYHSIALQLAEGDILRHLPRHDKELRGYESTPQFNRY